MFISGITICCIVAIPALILKLLDVNYIISKYYCHLLGYIYTAGVLFILYNSGF